MKYFSKPYLTMVVDDDQVLGEMIVDLLDQKYGDLLKVHFFSNPKEAYDFAKMNSVSIILCDMKMPGITGNDFLSMCQELDSGAKTIAMSGHPGVSTIVARYQRGDIGYLVKPFDQNDVYKHFDIAIASLQSWEDLVNKFIA